MRTTIDTAGRVVIPKPLRDRLGLTGGQDLEVAERDGIIEIAPAPAAVELRDDEGLTAAVPHEKLPPLTADVVRDTLERSRR
jgi:AbrB family looped-hinge helix DNA binding protein